MDILSIIKRVIDPFGVEKKNLTPARRVKRKVWGKVVAKSLNGYTCGYTAYKHEEDRHDCCPICHNTIFPTPPTDFVFRKRTGDYWCTYDGFKIVSEKFKQFCELHKYPNLTFTPIRKSSGYYFFMTNEIIKMDYDRSGVKLLNKRECCDNYDVVLGNLEFRAKDETVHVKDFIARAELFMGSGNRKTPLICVGLETAKLMKEYGLTEIYFRDVYEPYD